MSDSAKLQPSGSLRIGFLKAKIKAPDDFDTMAAEEIADLFEGPVEERPAKSDRIVKSSNPPLPRTRATWDSAAAPSAGHAEHRRPGQL